MKAITRREYGSPEVLGLEEVARPEVGDDEVLVEVRAASVNASDVENLVGKPAGPAPRRGGRGARQGRHHDVR